MNDIFIPRKDLDVWLAKIAEDRTVYAPTRQEGAVVYRPYAVGTKVELDTMPTTSPKEVVFPQNETLLTYKRTGGAETGNTGVETRETLPEGEAVVFGARPCGVQGLLDLDMVYNNDLNSDAYYAARRENTLVVTMACVAPRPTCFCTSVGGGPGETQGSDVMLYPLDDGFVARALSSGGETLLALAPGSPAGDKSDQAKGVIEEARKAMGAPMDLTKVRENFDRCFDDLEFWDEQSAKCLSCGACAYLCPTCHCFNITDEGSQTEGKRLRSWDNCMSYMFTTEASGHNPRAAKSMRLRNRIGHKFVYFPETHEDSLACCGCGRCIVSCPSSMDVRQIVKAIQEYPDDQE